MRHGTLSGLLRSPARLARERVSRKGDWRRGVTRTSGRSSISPLVVNEDHRRKAWDLCRYGGENRSRNGLRWSWIPKHLSMIVGRLVAGGASRRRIGSITGSVGIMSGSSPEVRPPFSNSATDYYQGTFVAVSLFRSAAFHRRR